MLLMLLLVGGFGEAEITEVTVTSVTIILELIVMSVSGGCDMFGVPNGCSHMTSSLLGSHVREGREHVATVSPTRTRWVSQ